MYVLCPNTVLSPLFSNYFLSHKYLKYVVWTLHDKVYRQTINVLHHHDFHHHIIKYLMFKIQFNFSF